MGESDNFQGDTRLKLHLSNSLLHLNNNNNNNIDNDNNNNDDNNNNNNNDNNNNNNNNNKNNNNENNISNYNNIMPYFESAYHKYDPMRCNKEKKRKE